MMAVNDGLDRRRWLSTVACAAATRNWMVGRDDEETTRLAELAERGRAARLGEFRVVSRGDLHVGTGDAPREFQETALRLCDALADDLLDHLERRHLPARRPERRLVVVILANADALAAFLGIEADPELRGLYDVREDWLAICDNRGDGGVRAERANTVTLHHEATHQLSFHCGLLDRNADTPLLVSEGFGTYGEVRRPDGKTRVGAVNRERLDVLGAAARSGEAMRPVSELVASDAPFDDATTRQMAYAQAWLFIHWTMQETPRQKRLAGYLDALRERRDGTHRVEDLTAHFGDLAALDGDLKRHANRLLRR